MDIRNRIVEFVEIPAGQLLDNAGNWRKHPAAQFEVMAELLERVGIVDSLLAYRSERNCGALTLIDGHLRKDIDPYQLWPVLIADLSDQEADLVLATFDPVTGLIQRDNEMLAQLLDNIRRESEDLVELVAKAHGEDLESLLADIGMAIPDDREDDTTIISAADMLQEKWQVQPGQVWQCGRHRIMCGDSTNAGDVARLLGGQEPLLTVCDPPYGVSYDASWRQDGGLSSTARRTEPVINDDRVDWRDAWGLCPGPVIYCWHAGRYASLVQQSLESVGFEIRSQIIWAKRHFPISRGHYHWRHEPCWYAVRKGQQAHWIGDHKQTTIWDDILLDNNVEGGHSTQKPLECMARPIRNHQGDVYDPFLGSGTTLIAGEMLGRICYGMEIHHPYVAVTLERYLNYTGDVPHLVAT